MNYVNSHGVHTASGSYPACGAQASVFHGQTGRGKTHLAIAVGHACVMAGKAVRFYKSSLTFSFGSKSYPPVTCARPERPGQTSVL